MRPTSSFSCAQRAFSASSSVCACAWSASSASRRAAWSAPVADSRSSAASSVATRARRRVRSSTGAGTAAWLMATRAQAVSSSDTPLSGNCRDGMKRADSLTASSTASSRMRTPWCFSSVATSPRSMAAARGSEGSSTFTTWKRRVSAASFSKYFLYSAQVVAATHRNSPRASAGFSRLAASFCPACPPAPMSVWASSMNMTMGVGDDFTASITPFRRFSNSPLTPAPACSSPRSSETRRTPFSASGTSPAAMRSARPSTTAVLPTPGSPVRMGLFWRRRVRMSTICRISLSRPRMGSIFPALACAVRSVQNCSSGPPARGAPSAVAPAPGVPALLAPVSACAASSLPAASSVRLPRIEATCSAASVGQLP